MCYYLVFALRIAQKRSERFEGIHHPNRPKTRSERSQRSNTAVPVAVSKRLRGKGESKHSAPPGHCRRGFRKTLLMTSDRGGFEVIQYT